MEFLCGCNICTLTLSAFRFIPFNDMFITYATSNKICRPICHTAVSERKGLKFVDLSAIQQYLNEKD